MRSSPFAQRSWSRLHCSTILAAILVFAVLILINIPGASDGLGRRHGWPFCFLYREAPVPQDRVFCGPYRIPEIWALTEDIASFRPFFLAADLVCACGLTLLMGGGAEWCRRVYGTFARFSLRTASAAIIVLSVGLAWIHYRVANWHRQQPAITALERAGGRIQYTSILPEWIRELMSDSIGRPFDKVIFVNLSYTKASDDDLRQLDLLPTVRSLDLAQTKVSNTGLRHVGRLVRLDWLSLADTPISDAGLVHLKTLRSLECLNLDKTRVEGYGLIHLQGLDKLNIVALRDGPLGDSGLQHLTVLPRLWTVYTSGSRVSRAGADVFRERSHNHIFVDYRYAADFGSGTSTSLGAGDADPFR